MFFILHSEINASSIGSNLGMPEYSYYFVLKGFQATLSSLGEVVVVQNPEKEVDAIYWTQRQRGTPCVFLSFAPPHKTITSLSCPTICVFAWESSTIPNEVWDNDPNNNWYSVLNRLAGAITLSTYTMRVVKGAMGQNYPVRAIPVPVFGEIHGNDVAIRSRYPVLQTRGLSVTCTAIDSKFYDITAETFRAEFPPEFFRLRSWSGEKVELGFKLGDEGSGFLGGFYESEPWGTWSRIAAPWILLPFVLQGRGKLSVELSVYGPNVNVVASLSLGEQSFPLPLSEQGGLYEFEFNLSKPVNLIQFSGLDVTGLPDGADPRCMGIGLRRLWLECSSGEVAPLTELSPLDLAFDGVVYTSVFNPGDNRKNWIEMLTGFCFAFREEPHATLVLKMTHRSVASFLGQFHYMLQRIGPIRCRVVILHGYLEDAAYQALRDITTYYVNTSYCEGLCLPLMEFMSCGIPAVTPDHTAMQDYVNSENAFIVKSSLEPFIWPHDSRDLIRTLRYRINWETLVEAYQESFRVAVESPEHYRRMSENATNMQHNFCSFTSVREQILSFFSTADLDDSGANHMTTPELRAV